MPATRLLRVVNELTAARDLPAVTAIVCAAARELTRADGVTLVLREDDVCYYADEEAIAPLWKGQRCPIHACIPGWTMLHAVPVVVPDIHADSRIPPEAYRQTFVRSLAMVPVRAPDPIAAIGAYWASPHRATKHELAVMNALADSTGLALTNARLFDDLRSALAREQEARVTAETATAAKDEFLALVAHELRQPLHACLAALRLMAVRASLEQGMRARDVVDRQIQHMNRLVEDLLDAARIVRGSVALRPAPVDLTAAMRQVSETVRPLMEERAHRFVLTLPAHPIVLQADEARLQQVLMNLLTNAAKYTDSGGRIILSAANSESDVTITVGDSGRGISAEMLPRVFELFARGAGDDSGFGVGLAVSRRLVELHGGTIEAHSAGVGHGSEFVIRLPAETRGQVLNSTNLPEIKT